MKVADVSQTSTRGAPVLQETVKIGCIWKGSASSSETKRTTGHHSSLGRSPDKGDRGPQGLGLALRHTTALWGRARTGIQVSCHLVWTSLEFFSCTPRESPNYNSCVTRTLKGSPFPQTLGTDKLPPQDFFETSRIICQGYPTTALLTVPSLSIIVSFPMLMSIPRQVIENVFQSLLYNGGI